MDRAQLADLLRTRREALTPEDVGLPRGPRRRTGGLRREEVAALCGMSTDYYTRLEQQRGPRPSEPMLAAIARGLRLTLAERDHLFVLAGHAAPARGGAVEHVAPGTMRVLDRLADTPAQVITDLGETLVQTAPATALLGDQTRFTGLARSTVYRWFTDPTSRLVYPPEDHERHGRVFASQLRAAWSRPARGATRAQAVVEALLRESEEFAAVWAAHEVGLRHDVTKRIAHPAVGVLEVQCQTLLDPETLQSLLVFTATPGTEDHDKLALLGSLGAREAGV